MTVLQQRRRRVSVRLDDITLEKITRITERERQTRTEVIIQLLARLMHDISFNRCNEKTMLQLVEKRISGTSYEHTTPIQLRLPSILLDFYRINNYNLTSAIRASLQL